MTGTEKNCLPRSVPNRYTSGVVSRLRFLPRSPVTFSFWFGRSSDTPSSSHGDGSGSERPARARDTLDANDGPASRSKRSDADTALINLIRAGDEDAFVSIVRTYATPLARFAYDYIGSVDIAEDIVDDVFVWIWEHRDRWDVTTSIRSYLFSATRNRALNVRRDAAYRVAWVARYPTASSESWMSTPPREASSVVESQELGELIRAAIDTLSEGRRTAILLRWMEEMSYAEIAAVMGTSVVGVKQQLNRALRDLREILPGHLK